ncbi:MAG: preprotein translocase subunit SecE [Planctomycetia bacterium]|nr:preprotein translocase subunit SecE [Planctomycetia bacterium]
MATTQDNTAAGGSLWSELLSFSVYKRSQGRVTRQATFAAIAITLAIGVWRLSQLLPLWLADANPLATGAGGADIGVYRFLVPGLLLAAGWWLAYRVVNVPRFADFLIAVESEMTKVSWPSAGEVARSSAVIIFLIFALAAILAGYDLFWWFVLRAIQGFK